MRLEYLVKNATAPCFSQKLDKAECERVISKVEEALSEKEIGLLGQMIGRALDLAWGEGHN